MTQWPGQEIAAPAQGGPTPVYRAPDPAGEYERQRDAAADARDARDEQRIIDKGSFERVSSLRKEFLGLEDVKAFRQVSNSTRQIIRLAERENSAMGDLGLVFSYMKALDPGSVVREGEFATAQNATGVPGAIRNAYNKMISGERLSDAQRQDMADSARAILNSRAEGYNEVARTYQGLLAQEGADPAANGITLFEIEQPEAPAEDPKVATKEDAIREGAEIRFGMDGSDERGVFDRSAYLEETYGISGSKEARLTASLNRLSGQQATPTQIAAIYGELGIPLPPDQELAGMAETLREGQTFSGFDTSAVKEAYEGALDQVLDLRGAAPESMSGAIGINAAQGLTFSLGDEISGVAGGVRALANGQPFADGYQAERDVVRREQERAQNARPVTSAVSELGGAVMTGALVPSRYLKSARDAAKVAASEGAVYGYGSGDGAVDSAVRAGAGAATGAALGYGAGRLSERLAARPARQGGDSEGAEVIYAADRTNARTGSNIEPIPADVGGPNIRRATGGAAQTTFGAAPVVRASQRVNDEVGGAVDTLAGREGPAGLSRQAAGEQAIAGADKAMKRLKAKVDANYTKARKLSGDTRVPLPNAKAAIMQNIEELADTPTGDKAIERFRDLAYQVEGEWTPEGIRRMRTQLRDEFVKDGLRGSDIERRFNEVIDAAELDIEQGLVAAGKTDAAKAWKQASQSAAERYQMIDDVIIPIIGRKGERSGEGAFGVIDRLSRGDAAALGKFMKAIPAEEAGAVRATIVSRLGRATPGQQDASGEAFSLSRFLTNWNDERLSKEAKSALFGGELRAALDDIALIAQGSKEAQRYANHSNTSGGNFFNALVNGGPFGAAFFDPVTAGGAIIGSVAMQGLTGRTLASPGFARWLARAGKVQTEGAARSHTMSLEKIAKAEPAIATEVLGLQSSILEALAGGATKAAAEPGQGQDGGSTTTGAGTP